MGIQKQYCPLPVTMQQGQDLDCLCFCGSSKKPHETKFLPHVLSDFQDLQFLNVSVTLIKKLKRKI